MSPSFSGDNLRFMMASNMEVIVLLLGELMFFLSSVLCLTLEYLMECGLDGIYSDGEDRTTTEQMGVDLMGASLMGVTLIRAALIGAALIGAALMGAAQMGAALMGAALIGAALMGSALMGAGLMTAALMGADWYFVARMAVNLMAAAYVVEKECHVFQSR